MMSANWSEALVLVIATAGILAFYIINRRQGMDLLPAVALACVIVGIIEFLVWLVKMRW
jgi:uncharacterized membrane protein YjjP (DUF1212 family)